MNKDDQEPRELRAITRREAIAASAAAAAVLALGTSGIYGYFTGTDEKRNVVSIAQNLQIRVVEPHWRPENAKAVVPGQTIPKDPQIENLHDKVPGYLFLEIRVPTAIVSLYDPETGSALPPARTELFTYEASDKWILLQEFADGDEMVRRYAWPNPVPAHSSTEPLFEEITFANLADVQGQQGKKKVTAIGYGIQSEGFTNPQDAWQAYKLQNGIGDGVPPADPVVGDIILNTNFIEIGEAYALARAKGEPETMSIGEVMKVAECVDEGTVVFESVQIVPNACYLMLPDIDEVTMEDVGKTFEADAEAIADFESTGELVYEANKRAFAVYSADDNSFRFYNRCLVEGIPITGSVYRNLEVTELFEGSRLSSGGLGWSPRVERDCKSVIFEDIVFLNTMLQSFLNFINLEVADLRKLDTSKIQSMESLFRGCSKLSSVKLPKHKDAPVLVNLANMFSDCGSLQSLDCSDFDVSHVRDMSSMFEYCTRLRTVDVSTWDTTNVRTMAYMFMNCGCLSSVDLSSFATPNVTQTMKMFMYCRSLSKVYVGESWSMDKVAHSSGNGMFEYCSAFLKGGSGTAWTSSNTNQIYARIDDPANGKPGYFTYKAAPAA